MINNIGQKINIMQINYRNPGVIRHICRQYTSNYKYSYLILRENTASLHYKPIFFLC
jgi:hypothetical protein